MKVAFVVFGLSMLGSIAANAQAPAAAPPPPPPAPLTAESKAPLVKGDAAPVRQTAFWMENGQPKAARGPDVAKAPKDSAVIDVKIFDLGGGQNYRQITIRKGDSFAPPRGDALIYVLKGQLDVKLGTVTGKVGPGDAFRKIGIQDNKYTALEETLIVETDAPASK